MNSILYCGDTSLSSAAAYLAGVMSLAELPFKYIASDEPFSANLLEEKRSLFIFSDYSANQISLALQEEVVAQVRQGAGLLMIGGWESFTGLQGHWKETPIGAVLPVDMLSADDRRNCDHPVFAIPKDENAAQHPILTTLPRVDRSPPIIGGFNQFVAKPDSQVLLESHLMTVDWAKKTLQSLERHPLLVVGKHHKGRTAAFATDVAPHWVGPMVDWGDHRISAQHPGAEAIEVGDLYARFFTQLVNWVRCR